ncbi:MAG: flavodoxin family protein [Firmicutes bacterium]|nr:flavodoxin family protein [Bacillota bacterium]
MKLVIHDLSPEEWEKYKDEYAGCGTVSDNGGIRPCSGCFCCWNKTPGKCVIRDGYENMGELIRRADEVIIISRYSFGCVSGFIKNIFDRCLGYVLPQFEVVRGGAKRVYVLANMGLYESRQLVNLFAQARQWSKKMGFDYCGSLGVSAGELIGGLMDIMPFDSLFMKKTAQGMDALSKAIDACARTDDIYTEPHRFPRSVYILIANTNWNRTAKQNGLRPKDLYRQL